MTNHRSHQRAPTTHESGPPSSHRLRERALTALVVVHSIDPNSINRVVQMKDELVVVGRDVPADGVRIDDNRLSRIHFKVTFDGRARTHRLDDSKSRNGTFVGGARVDSTPLRPGDVIRAGDTVFVYGDSDPLARVRHRVARVAKSNLSVLLLGETGTGKERLARAVHELGGRNGPFVAVNCAAFPRELLSSELFGHARGAFSGATHARLGLFQSANGGTLFLDEIGDFPLELQAYLLRALEEGVIRPIGSDQDVQVDVRIVAATHARLDEAVKSGRFRADLYARIAGSVVNIPPLRERRAEVLVIAREIAAAAGAKAFDVRADAAEVLVRHSWPFNIRELESVVRGFVATEGDVVLGLGYLKEHHTGLVVAFREDEAPPMTRRFGTDSVRDRESLEMLLNRHLGNVSAVAKELGKQRAQVYRWLKEQGLDPDRYRSEE
jgi:transcriptional regulator with GAF, ATPase, and Fis domain